MANKPTIQLSLPEIKSNLEFKDYLTISLSSLALITSIIGVYFANIRVEDKLSAKIVSYGTMNKRTDGMHNDSIFVDIAFINSGNRQSMINDINCGLYYSTSDEKTSLQLEINDTKRLPFILESRQMKVLHLKFCVQDLKVFRELKKVNKNDPSLTRTFLRFFYYGIDSRGIDHQVISPFEIMVQRKNGFFFDISSIAKGDRYAPTKNITIF